MTHIVAAINHAIWATAIEWGAKRAKTKSQQTMARSKKMLSWDALSDCFMPKSSTIHTGCAVNRSF
jgi:hypothetical protein